MKMLFKGVKMFKATKQKTKTELIREKISVYEYAILRTEIKKELIKQYNLNK